MLATEPGMFTEVSPLQPENASLPMLATEPGMLMEVSPLQPENASLPMEVRLPGSFTATREVLLVLVKPGLTLINACSGISLAG